MFDDNLKNLPTSAPSNLPLVKEPEDMFANLDNSDKPTLASSSNLSSNNDSLPNALASGKLKIKEPASAGVLGAFPNTPPVSGQQNTNIAAPAPVYTMKEPVLGKIILLLFLLLVLAGMGYGGYWFYSQYFSQSGNNKNNVGDVFTPTSDNKLISTTTQNNDLTKITSTTSNVSYTTDTEVVSDDTDITTGTNIVQDASNDKVLFGEPVDSDHDGLDDIREKALGTNPNNPDTDGDGVNDGDEVNIWKTDPNNPDTDGDGYTDGQEIKNGYNPRGQGKIFDSVTDNNTDSTNTKK